MYAVVSMRDASSCLGGGEEGDEGEGKEEEEGEEKDEEEGEKRRKRMEEEE